MLIRLVRKFGEQIHSFTVSGRYDENKELIPGLGDHVEVDNQRYIIVDRTFDLEKDEVVIQCWQPVVGKDEDF